MTLRKWLFFFSVWGFLPVEGAETSFSREGAAFSYKVVENEFSTSERSVMDLCPECLSGDKTASEVKALSFAACEQVVKSEQCREVEPKYLRDCEEEEEEGTLAFGQRVLGCMKGTALEGDIGLGIGAVIGKVIVGIGALLGVPFVGPALGVAAGGGAALYAFVEYDRAYREVEEGDGRALKATGQMFGNMGTGIYRLFLGNYECYNPQGRAWEVCGLLLGGVAGGGAALSTVKKAATKAKPIGIRMQEASEKHLRASEKYAAKMKEALEEMESKRGTAGFNAAVNKYNAETSKIVKEYAAAQEAYRKVQRPWLKDARKKIKKIEEANKKNVSLRVRNQFEGISREVDSVESFFRRNSGLEGIGENPKLTGLTRMRNVQAGEWEQLLKGVRETKLPLKEALAARQDMMDDAVIRNIQSDKWDDVVRAATGNTFDSNVRVLGPRFRSIGGDYYRNVDEKALFSYINRKKAFEKSAHRLTRDQNEALSALQKAAWRKSRDEAPVKYDEVVDMIDKGLSPDNFRKLVDSNLISTDEAINNTVKSFIKQYEAVN